MWPRTPSLRGKRPGANSLTEPSGGANSDEVCERPWRERSRIAALLSVWWACLLLDIAAQSTTHVSYNSTLARNARQLVYPGMCLDWMSGVWDINNTPGQQRLSNAFSSTTNIQPTSALATIARCCFLQQQQVYDTNASLHKRLIEAAVRPTSHHPP